MLRHHIGTLDTINGAKLIAELQGGESPGAHRLSRHGRVRGTGRFGMRAGLVGTRGALSNGRLMLQRTRRRTPEKMMALFSTRQLDGISQLLMVLPCDGGFHFLVSMGTMGRRRYQ